MEQADIFIRTVTGKKLQFYALDIETGPNNRVVIGQKHNVFTALDFEDIRMWIDYVT